MSGRGLDFSVHLEAGVLSQFQAGGSEGAISRVIGLERVFARVFRSLWEFRWHVWLRRRRLKVNQAESNLIKADHGRWIRVKTGYFGIIWAIPACRWVVFSATGEPGVESMAVMTD